MLSLACLLLSPGAIEPVASPDFSKKTQVTAITATVRVVNVAQRTEGSGVILGRKGDFVYILTAYHVVEGARALEVDTVSAASYPRPEKVYNSVRIVAKAEDMRDLALIRVVTKDTMPAMLSLCPTRQLPEGKGSKALTVGCEDKEPPT